MPTFLTSAKMHPDLAARIEASLNGPLYGGSRGRGQSPRRMAVTAPGFGRGYRGVAPRYVALARFGFVLMVFVLGYVIYVTRRQTRHEESSARTDLLAAHAKRAAELTDTDKTFAIRAEKALIAYSRDYDEILTDDVAKEGAFTATLTRSMVYVRGPIGTFATPQGVAETARASAKDAFVLCLLSPPDSRTEAAMFPKIRIAYGTGGTLEAQTPNVRRLWEAAVGLPLLQPAFADRIRKAEAAELLTLRRELERTPIDRTIQAAKSPLMLAVLDEPGEGTGPTELDGERPHWVRVGLLDLKEGRTLLSTRRHVDPAWISGSKRSEYAAGLDSCMLAFDIREAIRTRR